MPRVPMMESFGVTPASLWNARDRSKGTRRPDAPGIAREPPASSVTHLPRPA